MTKNEALEAAQSAPPPVQDLLNELIERAYADDSGAAKKARKKKAPKKDAPPPAQSRKT